jgi:hypothetical protein
MDFHPAEARASLDGKVQEVKGAGVEWLRQKKSEDPATFWREVEARRGGTVGFFSFATLLGRSDGSRLDLPGLLYTVNETAWFEDFEKDNWLYRVMTGNRKFEKTEISFGLGEVARVRVVRRGAAARCLHGSVRADALPTASALSQFFAAPVTAVTLRTGSTIFFDLLKRKEFMALFRTPAP